jgi:hypothetical protein
MTWVCIDCGHRQAAEGTCTACGHEPILDLRDEKVRELMRDVDLRLQLRREGRFRLIGVIVGMTVIFALWTRSAYWAARGTFYPGLPFLIDQWLFMALIGLGLSKLLEKKFAKRRFPYLRDDLTLG